jgi:4a-hydroxytetrahydrobiopterin dehydratase
MDTLNSLKCVPCRGDEPPASLKEIQNYRSQIPEWEVKQLDGVKQLERSFKFEDFKQALRFTNKIGEIAEEEGHHPVITTQWGKVKVSWWTHKIKGLHRNDFIMAAKTDEKYNSIQK